MYQGLENTSRAPFVVPMCCMVVVVVQHVRTHRDAVAPPSSCVCKREGLVVRHNYSVYYKNS